MEELKYKIWVNNIYAFIDHNQIIKKRLFLNEPWI